MSGTGNKRVAAEAALLIAGSFLPGNYVFLRNGLVLYFLTSASSALCADEKFKLYSPSSCRALSAVSGGAAIWNSRCLAWKFLKGPSF